MVVILCWVVGVLGCSLLSSSPKGWVGVVSFRVYVYGMCMVCVFGCFLGYLCFRLIVYICVCYLYVWGVRVLPTVIQSEGLG